MRTKKKRPGPEVGNTCCSMSAGVGKRFKGLVGRVRHKVCLQGFGRTTTFGDQARSLKNMPGIVRAERRSKRRRTKKAPRFSKYAIVV